MYRNPGFPCSGFQAAGMWCDWEGNALLPGAGGAGWPESAQAGTGPAASR